jgi:hypothetical protein
MKVVLAPDGNQTAISRLSKGTNLQRMYFDCTAYIFFCQWYWVVSVHADRCKKSG